MHLIARDLVDYTVSDSCTYNKETARRHILLTDSVIQASKQLCADKIKKYCLNAASM